MFLGSLAASSGNSVPNHSYWGLLSITIIAIPLVSYLPVYTSILYDASSILLIAILAQISVDLKHRVRCAVRHVARFWVRIADSWLLSLRTAEPSTDQICENTKRDGYLRDVEQMLLGWGWIRGSINCMSRVDACFGSDVPSRPDVKRGSYGLQLKRYTLYHILIVRSKVRVGVSRGAHHTWVCSSRIDEQVLLPDFHSLKHREV